ncbi:MAG: chloride channel protein [Phycisphaerales bacterium]|nr:MAG: chloride channel protein [Phycisphaerales bacterium]
MTDVGEQPRPSTPGDPPKPAWRAVFSHINNARDWWLVCIGAMIGVVTAMGAIGFVTLVHWAEDRAAQAAREWPWWTLPAIPMLGALLTGLLVHYFAREARGHGVPEVMDAIVRRGGKVRPRVAIVKSIASACTIGSGGSAGAEGPIVQIGAAIGSAISQVLRVSREHTNTLLGCGAAAGIASVFNAPIAGVFFVLEILLRDFSVRTFTPIVIASVFSTAVTQAVLGENEALFASAREIEGYAFTFGELPSYIALGLLCGVIAVIFVRMLYASEDVAARVPVHPVVKPVIGALLLGLLGLAYLAMLRGGPGAPTYPSFFGNGYEAIRNLINPISYRAGASDAMANVPIGGVLDAELASAVPFTLWVVGLMLVFKIVGTCCTLGSGGSGGVFAPSLFMGAAAGAVFGIALERIGLMPPGGSPAAYALVGMAALVAGTTHAPLTAILILFEITRDVYVLLPIMLAAVVATLLAQLLLRDSVYSLKLRRRGVRLGTTMDWTIMRRINARQVQLTPHVGVRLGDPASRLLDIVQRYQVEDFVVLSADGRYAGMVTGRDLRTALIAHEALPLLVVEELTRTDLPTIDPNETLDTVMDKFSGHDVSSLPVVDPDDTSRVLGLMTRARMLQRYQRALEED